MKSDAPNHLTKYSPDIDGLRAIAVLAVVGYHAFPAAIPGGFVGVDIFFVISGYLITGLLRSEWKSRGTIDITAFYARRIRRIFPMLALVTTSVVAASILLLNDRAATQNVANSAAAALLFAGNWYFQVNTGGYFDPVVEELPLLHLWSLGVEEQFYVVLPVVLVLVLRWRPTILFRIVAQLAVASALLAALLSIANPNAAFFLMPSRFWELAVGGLVALAVPARSSDGGRYAASVGVAFMLLAMAVPSRHLQATNVPLAVVGAVLLLRAIQAQLELGFVQTVLRSRMAIFFGLISYSLYLWHWPLLAIGKAITPGGLAVWERAAICLASVVLAWLSFRFVENPLRRPSATTSNGSLVLAGALTTCVLAYLSFVIANEMSPGAKPSNVLAEATANDYPANRDKCHYMVISELDDFPRKQCARGRPRSGPGRIVIWGDSRAFAWQPLAWALANREGVSVINFTRDSCPPALSFDNKSNSPAAAAKCREFNVLAANQLRLTDTVILAAAWPGNPQEGDFERKFASTLVEVSPKVKRLILLGPTPWLRDNVPKCIALNSPEACAISRAEFASQADLVSSTLAAQASRFNNVEYVSLDAFFCNSEVCPATKDGYGLYWDSHHVSSKAASTFAAEYLSDAR